MGFSLSRLGSHFNHLGDQGDLDPHPGFNLLLEDNFNLLLEDGLSVLLLE